MLTDKDILRDEIERACCITGKLFIERESTITVIHGPKFLFTSDGELKSIIKDGRSFSSDGERRYVAPKGGGKE